MSAPVITSQRPTLPVRHLRILYADDMPELREIVRLTVSHDGHGIECFPDGQVALHRVTVDQGFDLVITDHHMPNLNGIEFVRGLRALSYRGRILVFSSELSTAIAADYRKLGVDGILYKPVYPAALREIIGELFPDSVERTPGR